MEKIVQYGLSTPIENATVIKTTRNGTTLQNFIMNVLTVKNTYKTGYRIGLVFMHLQDGKSIYSTAFICNAAWISCSVAAIGCRAVDKLRPMGGLSLLADGLSICGDVISKGGQDRPKIRQILM